MDKDNIEVVEAVSMDDMQKFVRLPFILYGDNPYWTPPLIQEEIDTLDRTKNPVFKNAQANYFLALKEGEVVGRIAVMINWIEVKELKKKKVEIPTMA